MDARAESAVRATLEGLHARRADYVLGGGWAVWAYEPGTPSVDCDVYVPGFPEDLRQELIGQGFTVGAMGQVEPLLMDVREDFLGFGDTDLGIPHPGFVRRKAIAEFCSVRALRFTSDHVDAVVPARSGLALAKLCALRNRDLFYRSFYDATAGMMLGPSLANQIRAMDQTYWRRKAGKDLHDLALLLSDSTTRPALQDLLVQEGLLDVVAPTLKELSPRVIEMASALAARVDRPPPLDIVLRLLE